MAEALLRVAGLAKRFGGVTALDGVNLEVAAGEAHALIGPNGAGKTTLVHQISGAMPCEEGDIYFDRVRITKHAMHERVRAGLARSYQVTSIFKRLSVLDNAALAVQARSGSSFRFWRPAIADKALFEAARRSLDQVGLAARADAPAGSLAHGEQRQLEVALALATHPKLLLLDEPTAGMGPEESERIVSLLVEIKRSVTLLLVEHDMPAVFRLADRISVLVGGRIIATGTPEAIRAHAEVRKAYLGHEAIA